MFHHTHRAVLRHVDVDSMVEHIYLNFIASEDALVAPTMLTLSKERFLARHDEPGFLTAGMLERFGVPYNFYRDDGGLQTVLRRISERYAEELGPADPANGRWSAAEFRKRFPSRAFTSCAYCPVRPIDLHHLLPRHDYPSLAYDSDNVVPLCIQAHAYISRKHLSTAESSGYSQAVRAWLRARPGSERQLAFRPVMAAIHQTIYGSGLVELTAKA
jgi:hypothetical protein